MVTWSDITIRPDDRALTALRDAWRWMIGETWTPLLFSAIGDVFIEVPAGAIWWLNTATGSLEQAADSAAAFHELLATEKADEWFLPGLVDALREHDKVLQIDQCYTYITLPVFSEGSYSVENMYPISAAAHFSLTGRIHHLIQQLPDGSTVSISLVD